MSLQKMCIIIALLVAALVFSAGCTQPTVKDKAVIPATTQIGTAVATPAATQAGTPFITPSASLGTTTSTPAPVKDQQRVKLETTMGDITIALDPDMPITAGNFESLVKKGYYNGVVFHRIINGFMIQGGDPTGTGRGGPGYKIPDEFTSHNKNVRGAIAMANSGPDTGGSQFFINLVDNSVRPTFDTHYPVFGNVVDGMDVVDAIGKVPTSGSPNDRPLQNVTIIRAELI
ncbi:MAG: peptidylprolyl isomerase [Methanomicrobiales archaeon]